MYKLIALLVGVAFLFSSCKKDPTVLGLDVQPTGDRILNIREFQIPVSAFTMSEDSIASDERTYNLIGAYNDPQFGQTSADIVTQVRLAANNVVFEQLTSIESITLYLSYSGCYGDTLTSQTPQKIKVFQLTSGIKLTDTLYSNLRINNYIDPSKNLALDASFTPNIHDTVLAIRLDTSLAGYILRAPASSLATADLFMEYFKGLYIQADTSRYGKIIMYYNLVSPRTKLSILYNNGKSYNMVINSNCARVNLFHHNYSGLPITFNDTLTDNSNNPNSRVYIQSMSGPRIKLKLPSLSTWQDSGIVVINKAELVLNVDETTIGAYAPPVKLFLVSANQNVKYSFLADYLKNKKYFGGTYDATSKSYKFNIPLQIQDLLSGSLSNNRLYLFPESNRTTGNRAVFYNNMKINITYTKL